LSTAALQTEKAAPKDGFSKNPKRVD